MAYYECADKKHTIKINCQMGWTANGSHMCTVSVYNDNKLIDTLKVAQANNGSFPLSLSRSYTI